MESKVRFLAIDMPEANELTLHVMAAFAEHEAKRISERTKDALKAAKARGVKLGAAGPANLRRCLEDRKAQADAAAQKLSGTLVALSSMGLSQRAIVRELNNAGVKAPHGGLWSLLQVQRLQSRLSQNRSTHMAI